MPRANINLKEQLKALGLSVVEKPPVYFGTLPVSGSQCELFYGKQSAVRATFGLNHEDVHDESYRKAGKLDMADFSMHFNAMEAGLLDVVSTELFEGKSSILPIRAELYKLNVYGEGSFFKPHMDTPREETMFGSLVITFPTRHEGGILTFRHEGKEWSVDSGKLIAEQAEPAVVYAAFYSDVEHEVLPVQHGYRVTATYNLYFVPQVSRFSKPVGNPIPAHRSALETTFTTLLADRKFLPKGGCLGFGLRHQYPLDKSADDVKVDRKAKNTVEPADPDDPFVPGPQLKALEQYLKGGDAMVKQVCDALKLKSFLGVVYRAQESMWSKGAVDVLCMRVVNLENPDDATLGADGYIDDSLDEYLRRNYGGKLLSVGKYSKQRDLEVEWVTDSPKVNYVRQEYIAFGNQAELMHAYFRVCLFVTVGAAGARETASTA